MSLDPIKRIIQMWKAGKLDITQTISKILGHLERNREDRLDIQARIARLEARLDELIRRLNGHG